MTPALASILSNEMVMQMAIFGAVAAAAWWLLDTMARRKPRAVERLEEFREPNTRKGDVLGGMKSSKGAVARVLEKASPVLGAPMKAKNAEEMSKTREKLNMAGFRSEAAPHIFWSLKVLGLAAGFLLSGGVLG